MSDSEDSGNADPSGSKAETSGLPGKWCRWAGVGGFLSVFFGTLVGILAVLLFNEIVSRAHDPHSADLRSSGRVAVYGVLVLVNAWISGLATRLFLSERSLAARRIAVVSLRFCLALAVLIFLDACFAASLMPGGDWAALNAVYPIMAGIAIAPLCVSGVVGLKGLSKLDECAGPEPKGRNVQVSALVIMAVAVNAVVGALASGLTLRSVAAISIRRAAAEEAFAEHRRAVDRTASGGMAVEGLIEALGDSHPEIRAAAIEGLSAKGAAAGPAVPELVNVVKGGEPAEANPATSALGAIGEAALPALIELLGDEDEGLRWRASLGLAEMGASAKPAIADLVRTLDDEDERVRMGARSALERIDPESIPVSPGRFARLSIERVSMAAAGEEGDGVSRYPVVSSDGRVVAFYSEAANLVAGDEEGRRDIFVRDLESGALERIPAADKSYEVYYPERGPSVSGDGRFVAFASNSLKLVPREARGGRKAARDRRGVSNVFVYDRVEGTMEWVPGAEDRRFLDTGFRDPSISDDGRFVAFMGSAEGLVPDYHPRFSDVLIYDRGSGSFECASIGLGGESRYERASEPSLSGGGRFVVFLSAVDHLVEDDGNEEKDIFVYDRETASVEGIAVSDATPRGLYNRSNPSISADGRFVAFMANAPTVVDEYPTGLSGSYMGDDMFVYDRESGSVEMILADGKSIGGGDPVISGDGRTVALISSIPSLGPYDENGNGGTDVFLYDREGRSFRRVSVANSGAEADKGNSGHVTSMRPAISGDGRVVTFSSEATTLVRGDSNGVADVFVSRIVLPEAQ